MTPPAPRQDEQAPEEIPNTARCEVKRACRPACSFLRRSPWRQGNAAPCSGATVLSVVWMRAPFGLFASDGRAVLF